MMFQADAMESGVFFLEYFVSVVLGVIEYLMQQTRTVSTASTICKELQRCIFGSTVKR